LKSAYVLYVNGLQHLLQTDQSHPEFVKVQPKVVRYVGEAEKLKEDWDQSAARLSPSRSRDQSAGNTAARAAASGATDGDSTRNKKRRRRRTNGEDAGAADRRRSRGRGGDGSGGDTGRRGLRSRSRGKYDRSASPRGRQPRVMLVPRRF
jgi:hypothetical protein